VERLSQRGAGARLIELRPEHAHEHIAAMRSKGTSRREVRQKRKPLRALGVERKLDPAVVFDAARSQRGEVKHRTDSCAPQFG
jgi:hypothetical protein